MENFIKYVKNYWRIKESEPIKQRNKSNIYKTIPDEDGYGIATPGMFDKFEKVGEVDFNNKKSIEEFKKSKIRSCGRVNAWTGESETMCYVLEDE